jgi:hypothetical protein
LSASIIPQSSVPFSALMATAMGVGHGPNMAGASLRPPPAGRRVKAAKGEPRGAKGSQGKWVKKVKKVVHGARRDRVAGDRLCANGRTHEEGWALTKCSPSPDKLLLTDQARRCSARDAKEHRSMHRMFILPAMIAAGLGVLLLLGGPGVPGSSLGVRLVSDTPMAYSGWAIGLLMGAFLAWFCSVDWAGMPVRLGGWWRLQKRRLTLVVLGGLFAACLLYF